MADYMDYEKTIILQNVNLQRNDVPLKRLLAAVPDQILRTRVLFSIITSSFPDAAIHLACTKISAWRNQEVS